MDIETFNSQYDDRVQFTVTYRDRSGDTLKGLLLSGVQWGTSKVPFVYINNYAKRVVLADVLALTNTNKPW